MILYSFKNLEQIGDYKISKKDFKDGVKLYLSDNSSWVLVRPSGTEPKLRIMTESKDASAADFAARSIELFIRTKFDI